MVSPGIQVSEEETKAQSSPGETLWNDLGTLDQK